MRILKFIGVTVGTLLLVFLLIFGFNLDALVTLSKNSDDLQEGQEWVPKTRSLKGLTQYIGANPGHVSLVSRSATNPDTTIRYQPDERRTMGTLANFFLVTTYARLVESGTIDPGEEVPLEETDRYQLPYIDASNHEDAKTALQNKEAVSDEGTVALENLVQAAIVFNDLAFADFLYYKLGEKAISRTFELLSLRQTDLPLPFSGLYITINPASDTTAETHFERLRDLSRQAFRDTVLTHTQTFTTDAAYREKVLETFRENKGVKLQFAKRRDALSFFPKSTAAELSELMIRLEKDKLISASVSNRVKDIMDWPYERQSLNNDFDSYGAIYDNRLGLLNGIDYGASSYSREPFGQAVFFDSLQVGFWFHMSSNLMHQDYQQRLMWDPALREATTRIIQTQ